MTQPPHQPPGPPNQPPGPPPNQPPYPSQQPPAAGAMLKLTVQGNALTSNMVPPTVTIDGHPAPAPAMGGSVMIPIPPGPHRIEVYSQWLRKYGQASLDINVQPNTELEVFYAPPFHQFSRGAMGFTEQKRAGVGCLIALLAFVVLFVLVVVIAAVLAG